MPGSSLLDLIRASYMRSSHRERLKDRVQQIELLENVETHMSSIRSSLKRELPDFGAIPKMFCLKSLATLCDQVLQVYLQHTVSSA